jgi:F-type H+-transporting ATPase subunit gamma
MTSAMQMIAANKFKKAQDNALASRPYVHALTKVCHSLPQVKPREYKRVTLVLIATDRGLCGGLNLKLFKAVRAKIQGWKAQNAKVELAVIGQKAQVFVQQQQLDVIAHVHHLPVQASFEDLLGVFHVVFERYQNVETDALFLAYNHFESTMVHVPQVEKILPFDAPEKSLQNMTFEPGVQAVNKRVLRRYVEALIYQGVAENHCSEYAARMIAMQNATDNAENLASELTLAYNKARQAAITQELCEIVAGASAL